LRNVSKGLRLRPVLSGSHFGRGRRFRDAITERKAVRWHAVATQVRQLASRYGAMVVVLIAGMVWRSNRFWWNPIALWQDEAFWATAMFERPLSGLMFRPLGYMAVTRLIAGVYTNEQTIRILSYVSGLASLGLMVHVSSLLFQSRIARVLCLFVVAFHPVLIDMSREFKPYSLEFCLHLGIVWLFLLHRRTGRRRWFWALLTSSVLAFFFAYNIVFLWPVIFLLLALPHLRDRKFLRLVPIVSAALLALLAAVAAYVVVLRHLNMKDQEAGWGEKYDVFYLEQRHRGEAASKSKPAWMAAKYAELSAFPGVGRRYWKWPASQPGASLSAAQDFDYYAWIALHFMGLGILIYRRRYQHLALFFLPLVLLPLANLLGFWPMGAFRVNTFLLAYLIPISIIAIDQLAAARRFGARSLGWGAAGLVLLPNLTVGFNTHSHKYAETAHFEMWELVRSMLELKATAGAADGRMTAGLDGYSCPPVDFYRRYHSGFQSEFGTSLAKGIELKCVRNIRFWRRAMRSATDPYLLIVSTDYVKADLDRSVNDSGLLLKKRVIGETHVVYLLKRR
jgi:hypothetical protein